MDLPDPRHTCARLLPLLLSQEHERLPTTLLAAPTAQSHHYLNTTPTQHEYLQPVTVKHGVIELHNKLIEAGHHDEVQVGEPMYNVDDTAIRSMVPIGNEGLSIVLMWEEASLPNSAFGHGDAHLEDEERPSWAFQTLDHVPSFASSPTTRHSLQKMWHSTLERAIEAVKDLIKSRPVNIGQQGTKIKSKQEMAEGEGTTPGAYGAAEDFWAGWNDDDDNDDETDTRRVVDQSNGAATGTHDNSTADDDYWGRYSRNGGSQIGDGTRSIGSTSFDNLDMDDGDDDAPMPAPRDQQHQSQPLPRAGTPEQKPVVQTRSRRSSTIKPPPTPPSVQQQQTDAPTSSKSKFYLADSSASSSADLDTSNKIHSNPLSAAGSAVALTSQITDMTTQRNDSGQGTKSTTLSAVPSFLSMDSRGSTGSFAMGQAPLDATSAFTARTLDRNKLEIINRELEQLQQSNGTEARTTRTSDAELEGLRFALAGVWQLFAKGRGGTAEQRDLFLKIASQVTQP
ncbi:hypothetical protein OIO90_006323 [Microbotryomycetes sp. JL221]|nr:hypothetical protein OIO90_006323 [Microbotryomycetes sp. JL221]